MTHSLHRSGDIESQKTDYVWFMYQTKGVNDVDIKPKALEFIAVAEAVGSENWGDVKTGPKLKYPIEEIKDNISDKSRIRGIFTKQEQVVEFLKTDQGKRSGNVSYHFGCTLRGDSRLQGGWCDTALDKLLPWSLGKEGQIAG
jgi:hypothetical protein